MALQRRPQPIEPVMCDGAPFDFSDYVATTELWVPVLARVLACSERELSFLVDALREEPDGEALGEVLAAFADLAARSSAIGGLFAAAHARVAAVAGFH